MKKTTPLIIVIIFAGFVLIGYLLASRVFKNHLEPRVTSTPETKVTLQQKNYLVFLVNDLQTKKPGLLAIWSVLATDSPTDKVFFVSLYPTADLSTNEQLLSLFDLRNNSTLTSSSYRRLTRLFNITTDGYFIIDNTSYLSFASNAGIDQLEVINNTPVSAEEVNALRSSTSSFFKSICDLFSSGAATSFFSKIDWSTTIPDHMVSDKTTGDITGLIDKLGNQTEFNTCKVILP